MLHPTEHAAAGVLNLLYGARSHTRRAFPLGTPAVNEDGALHVFWRNGNKHVELIYPATGEELPSLYVQDGDAYELLEPITSSLVAARLDWLTMP